MSEGQKSFTEIAISANDQGNLTSPCGVYRPVLIEFGNNITIYITKFNSPLTNCSGLVRSSHFHRVYGLQGYPGIIKCIPAKMISQSAFSCKFNQTGYKFTCTVYVLDKSCQR